MYGSTILVILIVQLAMTSIIDDCESKDNGHGGCASDYFNWTIPKHQPTGLCCPHYCKDRPLINYGSCNRCCTCKNRPYFSSRTLTRLLIEYIDLRGSAILISATSIPNDLLDVFHMNGYLQRIPCNVCEFPGIVKIELNNNHIKQIGNITCLKYLDTLNLENNEIEIVRNDSFVGLSYLRKINLSRNKISMMEARTLSDSSLALQFVDVSDNFMKQIDVTNIIIDKSFCTFDFSNNHIDDVTNDLGWEIDLNKNYGDGGFISFQNNDFTSFINFEKVGITDLAALGKVLNYGFDFRGINITCNGDLVDLLKLSKPVIEKLWRDYMNVTCAEPENLRGQSIPKLVMENKLDLFVTPLSKCPIGCNCTEQPSRDRTIVNCSALNLTEFPSFMPDKKNLEIHLDNNHITELKTTSYFDRISLLDISNNRLEKLDEDAISTLRNISWLNLTGNSKLSHFPASIRNIEPCQLNITGLYVRCDCSNTWISEWLNSKGIQKCSDRTGLMCITNKGNYAADLTTSDFLECKNKPSSYPLTIGLAVTILLTISTAVVLHYYRYEFYILFRNVCHRQAKEKVNPLKKYDVYICCYDPNNSMRSWVIRTLIANLEKSRYRVCFPDRDFLSGSVRSEESVGHINRSKNFLVIMSEHYFLEDNPWGRIEWSHAWNLYRSRKIENIIIINYDQQRTSDIDERRMKAFFRLRIPLDFSNQKNTLIEDVKERLGTRIIPVNFGLENANVKFGGLNNRFIPNVWNVK